MRGAGGEKEYKAPSKRTREGDKGRGKSDERVGQQETRSATEEEKSSRLCRQRRQSRDSRMERRWQQVGGAEDETRRNICLFG